MADPDPHITHTVEHGSKRHAPDRAGNLLLVILSPPVLAWTLYSFWRLADKGTQLVQDQGRLIETASGFNFWLTLTLYGLLSLGALVVLTVFARRLTRRRRT